MEFVKPPEQPFANVLLYGPAKVGKTAGACTAPGAELLLNADLPNATHYAHLKDTDGRIAELKYEGKSTLQEVMQGAYPKTGSSWDTVILDPVGELHRRLLEEISNMAVRPTQSQYGDVSTMIERFCRFMCEAPCNFVIVCHEVASKDETTGVFERMPWTGTNNPALGAKLLNMVDIIGYCGVTPQEDGGKLYAAQLVSFGGRRGGDRFDCLGDWQPLDLSSWFAMAGCHVGDPRVATLPQRDPTPPSDPQAGPTSAEGGFSETSPTAGQTTTTAESSSEAQRAAEAIAAKHAEDKPAARRGRKAAA